jgi:hypothetical protein
MMFDALETALTKIFGLDVVVGGRVALARDDAARACAEPAPQAVDEVLAVVVVLEEDRDPAGRHRPPDVGPVHRALRDIGRLVRDRPRVLAVVAAHRRRAGGREQLRHLDLVQERPDGQVVLGSE